MLKCSAPNTMSCPAARLTGRAFHTVAVGAPTACLATMLERHNGLDTPGKLQAPEEKEFEPTATTGMAGGKGAGGVEGNGGGGDGGGAKVDS